MGDVGVPGLDEFEYSSDTPACPKCGAPVDRGLVAAAGIALPLSYFPSVSPLSSTASLEARSCLSCGYTELFANPEDLRCALAGIQPPSGQ